MFGVKVYVVVALLLIAGAHVPVNPFVELVGNVNVLPEQIAGNCVNVGVTGVFTVTVKVVVNAHGFPVGVNVYVVVALLFIAGLHVPVTPFVDVVGKVNEPPTQIDAIGTKVGVTLGLTVTVNVAVVAH